MLGEVVGNYRIVAQIAAGGMGVVYRAEHVSIGKVVAVKLLLDEFSQNESIVQRFLTEAKAVAAIKHPGIIEIFDYGTLPNGRAYIVMELLEGETLKRRLRRQRVPEAEAIWITRSIASAVGAAHERGVIHRDLKPENIFLVPDPDLPAGERPKVLDFGLAKLTMTDEDGASQRTRTGAVMGTPTYMAPEQCRGAGYVDHRADLYALGCILYEMLCGRPPFVAQGVGEIIGAHLYAPVEPPRRWNAEVTPALEQIALRLLAKSPDERFQTMEELRRAIDASMGRAPTSMPSVRQTAGSLMIPPAALAATAPVPSLPGTQSPAGQRSAGQSAGDSRYVDTRHPEPRAGEPYEAPPGAGTSTLGGSAAQLVPTLPVHGSDARGNRSGRPQHGGLASTQSGASVARGKAVLGWILGGGAAVLLGLGLALLIGFQGGDDVAEPVTVVYVDTADAAPATGNQEPTAAASADATVAEPAVDTAADAAPEGEPEATPEEEPEGEEAGEEAAGNSAVTAVTGTTEERPGESSRKPNERKSSGSAGSGSSIDSTKLLGQNERRDSKPSATVQVRLRITPDTAKVQVDGKTVSARKLNLSPGPHSITVSAPGYKTETRAIKVTRDRVETFSLERSTAVPPVSTKL